MLTLETGDRAAMAEAAAILARVAAAAGSLPGMQAAAYLFAVLCLPYEEAVAHSRATGLPVPDRATYEANLAAARTLAASIGSHPAEVQH